MTRLSLVSACMSIRFVTKDSFSFSHIDGLQRRTEKLVDRTEKPDATYRCYLFTLHNFCGLQACVEPFVSFAAFVACFICTGLQL